MARQFDDGSTQYLQVNSTPVTSPPFTMGCWFQTDDDTISQSIMGVSDKDVDYELHHLIYKGATDGDPVQAQSISAGGGWDQSTITLKITLNTWSYVVGIWAASNSRIIYVDNDFGFENTNENAPTGIDCAFFGVQRALSLSFPLSGMVAEPAIWNAVLTVDEIAILTAGYVPPMVRPQNLVYYVPMVRDNDEDIVGGLSLTAYNSPTVGVHPPVIYPAPPIFYSIPSAVAADALPMAMNHYRRLRT